MKRVIVLIGCILTIAGCEGRSLNSREKGALTGGALGAGLGAIVGNQVGSSGAGIAIGSAIGAISGGLIGNSMDATDRQLEERERTLSEQQRQLEENRRILDELRRNGQDVRTTDRGIVVNLPDVLFRFNSSEITAPARQTAAEIARAVANAGGRRISVEGHTDSIGTVEYNQRLSKARANSVADELVNNGVTSSRIVTRGYGEGRPVASNADESGRQKNRRVEVIIENR